MKQPMILFRAVGGLAVCAALAAFVSCENPYTNKGMFSEISKEIKLTESNVKGNIFTVFASERYVFAGGGGIYYKPLSIGREWKAFPTSGFTGGARARRLALGAGSDGAEYLYALRMLQDENYEDVFSVSLYYWKLDSANNITNGSWEPVDLSGFATDDVSEGTLNQYTVFSDNNAVAAQRKAYLTAPDGVYELTNGALGKKVAVDNSAAYGTASSATRSAVLIDSKTYFSSSLAACANADNSKGWVIEDGAVKYWYGSAMQDSGVSVSNAVSLTYSAKDNCLYAGRGGSGSGAVRIDLDTEGKPTGTSEIGGNTDAAIGSYNVYALYCEQGANTLYASTIGRGSTFSSMYNGLWGRYDPESSVDAQDKGNWNRE